jgi:hypothetical protein
MRRIPFGGAALTAVVAAILGCTAGVEPAPEGWHYEWVNTGKRRDQVLVPDDPSVNKPLRVAVRSTSEQPGPGDYYVYATEGKRVTRILVHDEDMKWEPHSQIMEVSADHVCPKCKPYYAPVGKQMERRYYCDVKIHVDPGPKAEN